MSQRKTFLIDRRLATATVLAIALASAGVACTKTNVSTTPQSVTAPVNKDLITESEAKSFAARSTHDEKVKSVFDTKKFTLEMNEDGSSDEISGLSLNTPAKTDKVRARKEAYISQSLADLFKGENRKTVVELVSRSFHIAASEKKDGGIMSTDSLDSAAYIYTRLSHMKAQNGGTFDGLKADDVNKDAIENPMTEIYQQLIQVNSRVAELEVQTGTISTMLKNHGEKLAAIESEQQKQKDRLDGHDVKFDEQGILNTALLNKDRQHDGRLDGHDAQFSAQEVVNQALRNADIYLEKRAEFLVSRAQIRAEARATRDQHNNEIIKLEERLKGIQNQINSKNGELSNPKGAARRLAVQEELKALETDFQVLNDQISELRKDVDYQQSLIDAENPMSLLKK